MFSLTAVLFMIFAYPAYLLVMAVVLKICGVSRDEIAKWVLRRADRQNLTDIVRSLRQTSDDGPG